MLSLPTIRKGLWQHSSICLRDHSLQQRYKPGVQLVASWMVCPPRGLCRASQGAFYGEITAMPASIRETSSINRHSLEGYIVANQMRRDVYAYNGTARSTARLNRQETPWRERRRACALGNARPQDWSPSSLSQARGTCAVLVHKGAARSLRWFSRVACKLYSQKLTAAGDLLLLVPIGEEAIVADSLPVVASVLVGAAVPGNLSTGRTRLSGTGNELPGSSR